MKYLGAHLISAIRDGKALKPLPDECENRVATLQFYIRLRLYYFITPLQPLQLKATAVNLLLQAQ